MCFWQFSELTRRNLSTVPLVWCWWPKFNLDLTRFCYQWNWCLFPFHHPQPKQSPYFTATCYTGTMGIKQAGPSWELNLTTLYYRLRAQDHSKQLPHMIIVYTHRNMHTDLLIASGHHSCALSLHDFGLNASTKVNSWPMYMSQSVDHKWVHQVTPQFNQVQIVDCHTV